MTRPTLPLTGTRGVRALTALAAAAALSLTGLAVAPAHSAPDAGCPEPLPVGDVTAGMGVHTLTVTHGTTPEPFTGTTLGVLHDGIAPGLDMILVDFGATDPSTPTEIDKAGIWEGMSGSPVYTTDGKLVGAVAYSLAAGISTVAGVTPAAEMQKLLTSSASGAQAFAATAPIPRTLAQRIVRQGAASPAQVSSGMHVLRVPFGISGMANAKRLDQLAKALGVRNARPMASGAVGPASAPVPIVPGGNAAASMSYGDVTAAGMGTATEVCGTEVLAFGHPMNFTGTSTMTLHGGDAIFVQPGPTDASFKVANLGAPVGTVDQDRLEGLHGVLGAPPATTLVSSRVTVGNSTRDGVTRISVPAAVPDIALAHVVADQDRVFDAVAGGSGAFSWTINLRQADGSPFRLHRYDVFADPSDLSSATVTDLAQTLYAIAGSSPGVHFESITTTSTLSHEVLGYSIDKVQLLRRGAWRTVSVAGGVALPAGRVAHLRVRLVSGKLPARFVRADLSVPRRAAGKLGELDVIGGNVPSPGAGAAGGDVFSAGSAADQPSPVNLDDIVQQFRSTPHHDEVISELSWLTGRSVPPIRHSRSRVATGHVVDGALSIPVHGVRVRH